MSHTMAMHCQSPSQSPRPFSPRVPPTQTAAAQFEEHASIVQPQAYRILTPPWSDPSRSNRPAPAVLPLPVPLNRPVPSPPSAIQSYHNTYSSNIVEDVLPLSDSVSGASHSNLPNSTPNVRFNQTIESSILPGFNNSTHHGLNLATNRPRTSYPVFQTTSELAAHHGIPRKLPPLPAQTTQQIRYRPPVPRFDNCNPPAEPEQLTPDLFPSDPQNYLQNLMADYLSMVTNFPVVDESNKKAFHTNMAVVLESAPDNGQSEDQFLAGVMNSISQQSGLTLTREHRMVDVWTIGQVPDAK